MYVCVFVRAYARAHMYIMYNMLKAATLVNAHEAPVACACALLNQVWCACRSAFLQHEETKGCGGWRGGGRGVVVRGEAKKMKDAKRFVRFVSRRPTGRAFVSFAYTRGLLLLSRSESESAESPWSGGNSGTVSRLCCIHPAAIALPCVIIISLLS
jgi:hypothetical protein